MSFGSGNPSFSGTNPGGKLVLLCDSVLLEGRQKGCQVAQDPLEIPVDLISFQVQAFVGCDLPHFSSHLAWK
jgi:hypothetical protein